MLFRTLPKDMNGGRGRRAAYWKALILKRIF